MTTFGEAVAKARRPRNQQWLADQMGVRQATVSDWERGNGFPRPESIPRLEEVLKLPPGYLLALRTGASAGATADLPNRDWTVDPDAIEGARHLSPADRQMVADLVARLVRESGIDPNNPPQ